MITNHQSYVYAESVVLNDFARTKIVPELQTGYVAPKYVVKQCREFLEIARGNNPKYVIDENKVEQIDGVLKLLTMPLGLRVGQTLYDCTTDYQWLFYVAVLCTVYRDDMEKRRYQTAILEICRKNFKTYTVGTILEILMLLEPNFSKFFSVAPDGALSREVKTAIETTILCSPTVYKDPRGIKRFKMLRDSIKCNVTNIEYKPLAYTNNKFDGKLPTVWIADEVGALPTIYALEAMRSGQLNIKNKLGMEISTKYPTVDNPFETECDYAKKILDGFINDESVFALLYEPDVEIAKEWLTNDLVLKQANPAALESIEIWDDLLKKRERAIEVESARENFLTKHCNIIYQGGTLETFVDIADLQKGRTDKIDWNNRTVYLGVDLSMTNDNTAVAMVSYDKEKDVVDAHVMGFLPADRIDEKSRSERVDYQLFINQMKAIACGDRTIDYNVVEDYVLKIEKKFNVHVRGIGFDRYNCLSSAQKWENAGYSAVEIKQHSSVLHSPTKWLAELIADGRFHYENNQLMEINFQNARCLYDTNMNRYVAKKKSKGKVDEVVAIINAMYLLEQEIRLDNALSWGVQM